MKGYSNTISAITCCIKLLPCLIMQSCIMTTTVQEIEDTVVSHQENYTSKAEASLKGMFKVQVQNKAENTMLQIDSIKICNILLADTLTNQICKGNIKIICRTCNLPYGSNIFTSEISVPPQKLVPWTTAELPAGSNSTYAEIHGAIYSYTTNNELFTIYSGAMYYPISGILTASMGGITNIAAIKIQSNCPLYAYHNGKIGKVLQPITFTATVNNWK